MRTKSYESEIWKYGGLFKGYTEDIDVAKRIMRWISVEPCCTYYTPSMKVFAYDFIFPTRTYNRVAVAFGLPKRRKSPERVKQGRLQKSKKIAEVKLTSVAV